MPKQKKALPATTSEPQLPEGFSITRYEITSEPIIEGAYKRLPDNVKAALERLFFLVQSRPRQAIPELEALLQTYPHVPNIYNYLSIAYSRAGEKERSEQIVLENYRRHPEYLFARINYADICLAKGDYAKIPDIFNHKFDLKLLYPKRKRFHISELTAFMGVMGQYFLAIDQRELAENIYNILQQVAPDHAYTKRLKHKLYPNFLQRLLERVKAHAMEKMREAEGGTREA